MTSDLDLTLRLEHAGTTVTTTVPEPADIEDVVEAIDYALRGLGFDAELIRRTLHDYDRPGR